MEISTALYLIKIFTVQGAYETNTNNSNIKHTHTYTHTHTHVLSFTDYIPPKYTYQKAENQTFGASFALSLSLSVSLLACTPVQVTCSFTKGKGG